MPRALTADLNLNSVSLSGLRVVTQGRLQLELEVGLGLGVRVPGPAYYLTPILTPSRSSSELAVKA